jgi:SAM-dependent methyltransferase
MSSVTLRIRQRLGRLLIPAAARLPKPIAQDIAPGTLIYRCNICGTLCKAAIAALEREQAHCPACSANMRFRAVVHHLSTHLFGRSLCIDDFPEDARNIEGIGMSDADLYATRLAAKLGYTNTFYHQEPRFDIQAPPASYLGRFQFIISSDVFEHVAPPVERAFTNLHRLLAPGGVLVFTVPFATQGRTQEHFPELHEYHIEREGEAFVLQNRTRDGRHQSFRDLIFHGGPGATLEMRLFSEADICAHLVNAGFSDIKVHREAAFPYGIYWNEPWSVPITARA